MLQIWRPRGLVTFLCLLSAEFLLGGLLTITAAAETVRVGVYANEPLVFKDRAGRYQGLGIDVLQAVAAAEGWTLQFVEGSWSECLQRLERGDIDLQVAIAISEDREQIFDFTDTPLLTNWGRLYSRKGDSLESLLDLNGQRVALLKGDVHASVFDWLIDGFGMSVEAVLLESYEEVLRAVEERRVSAGVVNRLFAMRNAHRYGVSITPMVFNPVKVHFAAPKGQNKELLRTVDRHLALLKQKDSSLYYQSLDRWFGAETSKRLPGWVLPVMTGFGSVLLLCLGMILALRWKVASRTRELRHEMDQCRLVRDQMSQREALFREIFNHIASGVAVYEVRDDGADFVFKDLNPTGLKMSRSQRDDVIGKSVREAFPGVDELGLFTVFQRVYRTGQPEHFPVSYYQDGQRQLYVENYVCKLPTGDIVAVFEDVTDFIRQERELKESLKRYETLFRAHGAPILLVDPETMAIIDANLAACDFYGYSYDELLKLQVPDIHTLDAQQIREKMDMVVGRLRRTFQLQHRIKGGSVRNVEVFSSLIMVGGRKIICSIINDISQRVEVERQLIRANNEWTTTFDSLPDVIVILDRDLRIVRLNQAACDLMNRSFDALIGEHCYEIFCHRDEGCDTCSGSKVFEDGKIHREEVSFRDSDKIFELVSSPIFNEAGDIEKLVHVAKDITQQKRLEEELVHSQKMEAVGTLAGGVAHDFNNILSAIIGFSEIAKLELPADSKAVRDIDQVILASQRAADLIKQILTFSRKDSSAVEEFQPELIVRESLKLLRSSVPTTVKIVEKVDRDCGWVKASVTKIHQIIMNLCTNAVHAMDNERGTLTVGLHRRTLQTDDLSDRKIAAGDYIVLSVEDDGRGMTRDVQDRIFEPYFTTKEVDRGTGLGLAVVFGIVNDCGGFIRVASTPGHGSRFLVFLPAIEPPRKNTFKTVAGGSARGGGEHILLVDDEPTLIAVNRSLLRKLGYRVTTETSSVRALELLQNQLNDFDLLITDQTMPELTGMDLIVAVRKISSDLPVILCTGFSSQIDEESVHAIKNTTLLMKPLSMENLAHQVDSVLHEMNQDRQKKS